MESVFGILAVKACVAIVFALGAAVAGRWAKRPGLVHALWIVVLLELLTPPLLELGIIPRTALPGVDDGVKRRVERSQAPYSTSAPSSSTPFPWVV